MRFPFFRIAPEGLPTVFSLAVLGWLFSLAGLEAVSFVFVFAFGLSLFFFRDPQRKSPAGDKVLAPADGKVIEVAAEREDDFLRREVTRVSIFLSIFDCHVNWFPVSGRVEISERRAGRFGFAFGKKASKKNERLLTLIKPSGSSAPEILMVQTAGFVARQIVSHAPAGAVLKRGERFGIIKFGSRIDLFFPSQYLIEVSEGDRVSGALTPIARLSDTQED